MKTNKSKLFLSVTSILSMLILLIGTTFSYFSINTKSNNDALAVQATKIILNLDIQPLYVGHKLIPTNDEDIMIAYESECVDIYGYGACLAYDIEVSNASMAQDLIGTIDFKVNKIQNLSYMLLEKDKDGNEKVYLEKTSINDGENKALPMGKNFILEDGTIDKKTSKKFVLLIWLTNLKEEDQNDYDGGGTFTAAITYESIYGKLTGSVNGFGEENGDVSQLEGE